MPVPTATRRLLYSCRVVFRGAWLPYLPLHLHNLVVTCSFHPLLPIHPPARLYPPLSFRLLYAR